MLNVSSDMPGSSSPATPPLPKLHSHADHHSKLCADLNTKRVNPLDNDAFFDSPLLAVDVPPDDRIKLRNDFIRKHLFSLSQIAESCVSKVRFKFRQLSRDDLHAYAFEGIIKGIEHTFGYKTRIPYRYLAIYGYENCLHGALSMVGICRRRKSSAASPFSDFMSLLPFAPDDIIQIQDNQFYDIHFHNNAEADIIYQLDAQLLSSHFKSKELKDLFQLLILGYNSIEIRSTLNINDRRYFYLRKKLFNILSRLYDFHPRQKPVPLKNLKQFYKSKNHSDTRPVKADSSHHPPVIHKKRYVKDLIRKSSSHFIQRSRVHFPPNLNQITIQKHMQTHHPHPIH